MKLVSVEEMRRIEELADQAGQSYDAMMERAGSWVASLAQTLTYPNRPEHALLLIGPGNNGGDGLVAAHYLREVECEVTLYIWKRDPKRDRNLTRLKRRRRGVNILWADNDADFAKLREEVRRTDVIVDALLGTGGTRPLAGRLAELLTVVKEELARLQATPADRPMFADGMPCAPLLEAFGAPSSPPLDDMDDLPDFDDEEGPSSGAARMAADEDEDDLWGDENGELLEDPPASGLLGAVLPLVPVVAVDCPTGLNCDTGALDPAALQASTTITFAYPKWGQVQYPGAGACGLLLVVDIGVPSHLAEDLPVELVERHQVRSWLPARPRDANKGTFGKVMVVGGSLLYPGAAALSASAAARSGAGLVTLAVPRELQPILAGTLLELTWLPLPGADGVHTAEGADRLVQRLKGYDALLVGPGLTTEPSAAAFLNALLGDGGLNLAAWLGRAVFDADALNLLATRPDWWTRLPAQSILTPHPGEMSRLTGLTIEEVNSHRIAIAQRYAHLWGHVVLLKGAHTVIAHPDGRTGVLPFADPALAKAGSGDVLAGILAAMLAQGLEPYQAAVAGGFVHGLAGVMAGAAEGPAGVTARELLAAAPRALKDLVRRP